MAVGGGNYEADDSDLLPASKAHMEIEKFLQTDVHKRSAFLPSFP